MKLAIISHTEHYRKGGQIVGLGPTVREINQLLPIFDEIWHIAPLHEGPANAQAIPYESPQIHLVPIPPSGGPRLADKWQSLRQMPQVLSTISQTLKHVDCFQFRAPTGMGNVVIPYLSLFSNKPGWFKYAGNWVQKNPPLGYQWQRWWLKNGQKRPVTLNGRWPNQAAHLHTFENPCFTEQEWDVAGQQTVQKHFGQALHLCFVGSLTPNKGIKALLNAIFLSKTPIFSQISIAGDGPLRTELEAIADTLPIPIQFLGHQNRAQLNDLYTQSHVIALPSKNEGFPKVIAEAAAHRCIPLVTDVSCIGQYVQTDQNGFLLAHPSENALLQQLEHMKSFEGNWFDLAEQARQMSRLFTYEHYRQRILDLGICPAC